MAQEAVGTEALAKDSSWASWSGLGPPGVKCAGEPVALLHRPDATPVRLSTAPMGHAALRLDDDGRQLIPNEESEWTQWVPAGMTRNWVLDDPLLDWLRLYGRAAGFVRDDERPDYDVRTDFRRFVLDKGLAFEAAVLRLLEQRTSVVRIAAGREDATSIAKADATVAALRAGTGIVAQGVLRNPHRQTYGVADLLVRSDLLALWFPELLANEEAAVAAPGLGRSPFHYRVVDIKFHTFELSTDGHISNSPEQLAYATQVAIYSEALGRIQGYQSPAAYLLGRTWRQGSDIGEGCLERLARVDMDRWLPGRNVTIHGLISEAVSWVRRVRAEGHEWHLLPEPSTRELYPHARNTDDAPWHRAKHEIAETLRELTLIPGMNPERRAAAHAAGIFRWDDERATAAQLGISSETYAARADAVLTANRSRPATVLPHRIKATDDQWRRTPPIEFYVDFETISNLDDDFRRLPRVGGQPLIVQIGCGQYTFDGKWLFRQWTAETLTPAAERYILDAWIAAILEDCRSLDCTIENIRICHWSAAEPANLDSAYNAARTRHPDASWPVRLPWFDVLGQVVRAAPVGVTGSFNFGLKSIAKALQQAGLIATQWKDGPADGLGAMVGIWSAAREASTKGIPLPEHPLMVDIARYNEIDCQAMAEVLTWLRNNR